jgi:cytochrome c oxidase subunit 3/cytochrome o ubiquinol oxidase subunit 3
MSAAAAAVPPAAQASHAPQAPESWKLPDRGVVGMLCLIVAEAAIFTIFVVAYLFYLGKNLSGPEPRDLLEVPIFISICLWGSSATVEFAVRALRQGKTGAFSLWWLLTIVLALIFLGGTAQEWHHLIYEKNFTVRTNLFGTTFYSLVGLHGFHVIVGIIALAVVQGFAWTGRVTRHHAERAHVLGLYWHFVDVVWVIVFTVVYVIGR